MWCSVSLYVTCAVHYDFDNNKILNIFVNDYWPPNFTFFLGHNISIHITVPCSLCLGWVMFICYVFMCNHVSCQPHHVCCLPHPVFLLFLWLLYPYAKMCSCYWPHRPWILNLSQIVCEGYSKWCEWLQIVQVISTFWFVFFLIIWK